VPGAARPKPIGSTEMIAAALRGAICSGEIAPGAPLKQDEIAAEFSVSHTPVREALKALVSEGLATLHHNRGCFVSDLSSTVARELMEFRAILEPRLAGWAIDHLTGRDIEHARLIMAKIENHIMHGESVSLWWQILAYVVLTAAEVLISITAGSDLTLFEVDQAASRPNYLESDRLCPWPVLRSSRLGRSEQSSEQNDAQLHRLYLTKMVRWPPHRNPELNVAQ